MEILKTVVNNLYVKPFKLTDGLPSIKNYFDVHINLKSRILFLVLFLLAK